jgi:hypothetical protein
MPEEGTVSEVRRIVSPQGLTVHAPEGLEWINSGHNAAQAERLLSGCRKLVLTADMRRKADIGLGFLSVVSTLQTVVCSLNTRVE